jgi:hypothetical protein
MSTDPYGRPGYEPGQYGPPPNPAAYPVGPPAAYGPPGSPGPQYQAYPGYPPPVPPPRKSNTGLIITIGVVAALVFCGIGGVSLALSGRKSADRDATAGASTPAVCGTNDCNAASPGRGAQPTTEAPPGTKAPAANTIVDGDWEVGTEVKPGTYKTTVPADSFGCYWERLKGFDGSFDSIIDNGNVDAGKTARVTIKATDKGFHAERCGTWTKVA